MLIVFVHGKKLLNNGELNPEFIYRLEKARQLFEDKKVDRIIIGGGKTRSHFPAECEKGYEYLIKKGVPGVKLERMDEVYSTYEEVVKLREYANKHKNITKYILLVAACQC